MQSSRRRAWGTRGSQVRDRSCWLRSTQNVCRRCPPRARRERFETGKGPCEARSASRCDSTDSPEPAAARGPWRSSRGSRGWIETWRAKTNAPRERWRGKSPPSSGLDSSLLAQRRGSRRAGSARCGRRSADHARCSAVMGRARRRASTCTADVVHITVVSVAGRWWIAVAQGRGTSRLARRSGSPLRARLFDRDPVERRQRGWRSVVRSSAQRLLSRDEGMT
jgi:hypothetical protein